MHLPWKSGLLTCSGFAIICFTAFQNCMDRTSAPPSCQDGHHLLGCACRRVVHPTLGNQYQPLYLVAHWQLVPLHLNYHPFSRDLRFSSWQIKGIGLSFLQVAWALYFHLTFEIGNLSFFTLNSVSANSTPKSPVPLFQPHSGLLEWSQHLVLRILHFLSVCWCLINCSMSVAHFWCTIPFAPSPSGGLDCTSGCSSQWPQAPSARAVWDLWGRLPAQE